MPTAADGIVQLPPDSTGKKLDTTEITRVDGTVVERQRLDVPDATDLLATVAETLAALLAETRVIRHVLARAYDAEDLAAALLED